MAVILAMPTWPMSLSSRGGAHRPACNRRQGHTADTYMPRRSATDGSPRGSCLPRLAGRRTVVQQGGSILLDQELDPVAIGGAEQVPEPGQLGRGSTAALCLKIWLVSQLHVRRPSQQSLLKEPTVSGVDALGRSLLHPGYHQRCCLASVTPCLFECLEHELVELGLHRPFPVHQFIEGDSIGPRGMRGV